MRALVAPIKALENCIQPFLQECDSNQDSKITDTEWATCLDLSDGKNSFKFQTRCLRDKGQHLV